MATKEITEAGYALSAPCASCPFRSDIAPYLRAGRARQIAEDLVSGAAVFHCHKTVDYDQPEDADDCSTPRIVEGRTQQCAGALITMERRGFAGQLTRIAERLGVYDASKLDMTAPVYPSLTDWINAHPGAIRTVDVDGEPMEYEHCGAVGPDCEDPAGYGGTGGVYESTDEPTCHPVDDCCSLCGHTTCTACRRTDPNDPTQIVCHTCWDEDEWGPWDEQG